jgi:8-oxo-dGTP pyrophosphatase MutT (NUDIX family)
MAKASRVEDAADRRAEQRPGHAPPGLRALETRIAACLDPLDGGAARPGGSDWDLNPELTVPLEGLQEAAVLIPLIERPEGLSVLLTQRADHMRRHAGQIAFPGGRCEPGETPWTAALREAQEEVGLDPALVRPAGRSTPYRTLTGYHITPVAGFVAAPLSLTLNPAEVAETFEVPFAFLMDPANHERRHRDQPPGPPRWHYAITWQGRVIWGATAAMLRALYERLEAPHAG